jgi:hypothetical protein
MAILYSYPTATPELQDLLVGTEMAVQGGEDSPRTRTFTISSISSLISIPLTTAINLKANIASPTFTGVVTSPSFVKTGGLVTQYLMANGSTSTMPTLQQVTTAGATITNPITITALGEDALTISAGSGTGITSDAPSGTGVYGSSFEGDGVTGYSVEGYGVVGSTVNGEGLFVTATGSGNGATIYANGTGNALVISGLNKGVTVVSGGISIIGNPNTDTTYQLSLSANSAAKPSTNTWTISSDERVKTNINPYTKGLETILAINPVTYDYNGKAGFDPATTGNIGIIAQDVLNIIPESINTYNAKLNEEDEEKTELYNFDSHALTFILINAVKQLSAEIELLKSI